MKRNVTIPLSVTKAHRSADSPSVEKPDDHMPYCDLALFHYPYEGVSAGRPRPGLTIEILIHENSCWLARRRNVSSEEVCIQEKCSTRAVLADLPNDEREQLLFIMDPRSS